MFPTANTSTNMILLWYHETYIQCCIIHISSSLSCRSFHLFFSWWGDMYMPVSCLLWNKVYVFFYELEHALEWKRKHNRYMQSYLSKPPKTNHTFQQSLTKQRTCTIAHFSKPTDFQCHNRTAIKTYPSIFAIRPILKSKSKTNQWIKN